MPITQERMRTLFIPVIRRQGQLYEKFRHVIARVSPGGERVESITSSGSETFNTSTPGDYIVQNQTSAAEKYIVPAGKFKERYHKVRDLGNGHAEYRPTGKVIAIALSEDLLERMDFGRRFRFEAPWGEAQLAMLYDFIVAPPDFSEVYRIGRQEFEETYRLVDDEEE